MALDWEMHATKFNGEDEIVYIDVMPIKDSYPHQFEGKCKCQPETSYDYKGVPIYVHDAFDGRHISEQARDILNEN